MDVIGLRDAALYAGLTLGDLQTQFLVQRGPLKD